MASYPSSIWSGNTRGTNLSDAHTHTKWHDDVMGEVVAIQTELGTAPSGASATVKAKLDTFDVTVTTWSSPFSSGVTVGNGTVTASYTQVGKIVACGLSFTLGSTSAITGDVILTLPVTAASTAYINGTARLIDTGTTVNFATVGGASSTTANVRVHNASTTYASTTTLSASVPFTWVTTDAIQLSLTYLAL